MKNLTDNSAITRLQAIVCVVIVTVSIAVVVYIAVNQNSASKNYYEKSIVRNTHTAEEGNALSVAENLNYTDIFKIDRFMASGLGYSNLSINSQYAYANFVDAEVLNYYDVRYESLKGRIWWVALNYSANASKWDKIHAVYFPPPENESMYPPSAVVRVLSSNGTVLNEYYWGNPRYAYGNSSGIQEIQANTVDFEFSSCYVVEMSLEYDEAIGLLAGFQSTVSQTVIVDENLKPLFICLTYAQAVS